MATDTKSPGEKKLSVTSTKTLTLKPRAETGVVRQSFSHGRSKAVVVEKVKRRLGPGEAKPAERATRAAERSATPRRGGVGGARRAAPAATAAAPRRHRAPKPSGVVLRTLTEDEQEPPRPRARRCEGARSRRAQDRRGRGEDPPPSAMRSNAPSARPPKRASATRKSAAATTKRPSARPTRSPRSVSAARKTRRLQAAARRRSRAGRTPEAEDDDRRPVRRGVGGAAGASRRGARRRRAPAPPKQRGRLTLVTALNADEVRERSVASFRRRTQRMTGHRDSEHEGKARARSDDPGDDHDPGTREPHVGARASTSSRC